MSKSNNFENDLLLLLFNNTAIANIGNTAGLQPSGVPGSFYVALSTGTLDDTHTAEQTETAYAPYARVAVARSTAGWTVTTNSVSPTADIDFAECTATPGAALTYFCITPGATATTADDIIYYGTLTPNITMATGVIPRIKSTSTITED